MNDMENKNTSSTPNRLTRPVDREKPKRTGGGGRAGDAREDGGQPIPLDPVT